MRVSNRKYFLLSFTCSRARRHYNRFITHELMGNMSHYRPKLHTSLTLTPVCGEEADVTSSCDPFRASKEDGLGVSCTLPSTASADLLTAFSEELRMAFATTHPVCRGSGVDTRWPERTELTEPGRFLPAYCSADTMMKDTG